MDGGTFDLFGKTYFWLLTNWSVLIGAFVVPHYRLSTVRQRLIQTLISRNPAFDTVEF